MGHMPAAWRRSVSMASRSQQLEIAAVGPPRTRSGRQLITVATATAAAAAKVAGAAAEEAGSESGSSSSELEFSTNGLPRESSRGQFHEHCPEGSFMSIWPKGRARTASSLFFDLPSLNIGTLSHYSTFDKCAARL